MNYQSYKFRKISSVQYFRLAYSFIFITTLFNLSFNRELFWIYSLGS